MFPFSTCLLNENASISRRDHTGCSPVVDSQMSFWHNVSLLSCVSFVVRVLHVEKHFFFLYHNMWKKLELRDTGWHRRRMETLAPCHCDKCNCDWIIRLFVTKIDRFQLFTKWQAEINFDNLIHIQTDGEWAIQTKPNYHQGSIISICIF